MNDVEVSVICLTYNHEKYIKQCLEGFLMQKTSFKFNVLVHDDASTDKTTDIVKEYVQKYPKMFIALYEKENQYSQDNGKKFSRQMIEMAQGNYIAICEGDDFWIDEYKLQKQYDVMENNPSVSIVVGKTICCNEDGSPSEKVFPQQIYGFNQSRIVKKEEIAKIVFGGYPFHTSSYFTKKTLRVRLLDRPFYDYMNGDERILREALAEGDFYYINDVLSCYRLSSIGGWSQRLSTRSPQKKAIHHLRNYYGHIEFDKITSSSYNLQIYDFIIKGIGDYGYADKKMFNEIRQYFKIKSIDVFKKSGAKRYCKYLLTIISPKFVQLISSLRGRIRKS